MFHDHARTLMFQEVLGEGIEEALVGRCDTLELFDQSGQVLYVMGAGIQERPMDNEAAARNPQAQFEAVVFLIFGRAKAVVGFPHKATVARAAGIRELRV